MQVFSRASEQEKLRQLMASHKPELVAIYGRRRVGKTFTVSQTLKENAAALYFEVTGSLRDDGRAQPLRDFLGDFSIALADVNYFFCCDNCFFWVWGRTRFEGRTEPTSGGAGKGAPVERQGFGADASGCWRLSKRRPGRLRKACWGASAFSLARCSSITTPDHRRARM